VKEYEIGRACSTNGEKRNAYRILAGNLERFSSMELVSKMHSYSGYKTFSKFLTVLMLECPVHIFR
jgi:hypothetical protein